MAHTYQTHPSTRLRISQRSGYNGYNHVGAGGIRLLGHSDPIATWDDTLGWLNGHTEAGGLRPYDYLLAMANLGTFLCHSLRNNVHDTAGNAWGYNGQFGMQGEYHVRLFLSILSLKPPGRRIALTDTNK